MAPFVRFDGIGHMSTPDINLLDADTAHLQQSVGKWVSISSNVISLSSDVPASFGDTVLKAVAGGIAIGMCRIGSGLTSQPVDPSTQYTWSFDTRTDTPNHELEIRIEQFDAAGASLGFVNYGYTTVPTADMARFSQTFTTQAGAAFNDLELRFRLIGGGAAAAGIVLYADAVQIAEGTDATFVPSLNIVGVLDETIVPPDMPIVYAADGTPLTVGAGWTGDGYSYIRRDGTAGPVVAQFDAGDIL